MNTYSPWIDGQLRPGGGATIPILDPSTGIAFAELSQGDANDVDDAVESAARTFADSDWARLAPLRRARVLNAAADRMRAERQRLAELESRNVGRPLRETLNNVDLAADAFAYFASLTTHLRGASVPIGPGLLDYTIKEPIGVCVLITPWNNPIVLSAWKIAAGLAAGNALVVKPASLTPASIIEMAQILAECGLPNGLLNIVPGPGREVGDGLVRDRRIGKVSFTGSTAVGMTVMQAAAEHVAKVSLELGGKSPSLVFADADLELAVAGSIPAMFANAGQMCTARSRILVEESCYEEFLPKFEARVRALRVGSPFDESSDLGPVISEKQLESVLGYIGRAVEVGAKVVCGGKRAVVRNCEGGFFVEPTILSHVTDDMEVVREEIFGPVVVVDRFRNEAEAVRRSNNTQFGLAATIWTRDLARAHRVASQLQVGTVTINTTKVSHVYAPFGGYKQSGLGRELGVEGLDEFLQVKNIIVGIPD